MNEFQQLSGFINAFGLQKGSTLFVRVEDDNALAIAEEAFEFSDYSSAPEFVAEVSSFVKRNGGVKDVTRVVTK